MFTVQTSSVTSTCAQFYGNKEFMKQFLTPSLWMKNLITPSM